MKKVKRPERPADYPKLENYAPTPFMLPTSHYDKRKADRAVKFIEMLPHTKGRWEGKPFWLLPWQETIIRDLFGVVKEDGTRQFRTVYVEIPKKNQRRFAAAAMWRKNNPSNCWNPLKPSALQRGDETRPCANAKKQTDDKMGNQQPSPEKGKVQRLSR